MIKKYLEFSMNEGHFTWNGEDCEYDVRQIFAELCQDMGFSIEIEKKFWNEDMTRHHHCVTDFCNKPIVFVSIVKVGDFEEADIVGLISHIYECIDKLSEMGDSSLDRFSIGREHDNRMKAFAMVRLDLGPEDE